MQTISRWLLESKVDLSSFRILSRNTRFRALPDARFQENVPTLANVSASRNICENGERAGTRTQDLLINLPPRLSPPPITGLVVWTFPSPYSLKTERRRVPSGLYTFPLRGLARDCRRRDADGFPDFDTISFTGFPVATPKIEVSCSTD